MPLFFVFMFMYSAFYLNYINSSRWKLLCVKVLERDQYLCQACKKKKATQVHHLTYDRLGYELLTDLTSVCARCHRIITRSNRRSRLRNFNI